MNKACLVPIDISTPPAHTQIMPRCATCKKFPVCNIREDYLKTAYLIQQVLGDPQDDRELRPDNGGFYGYDFETPENLFPATIEVALCEQEFSGKFQNAKYINKDNIRLLYKIDGYLVIFKATWSEEFAKYELSDGKEIYYDIIFTIKTTEFDDAALQVWREEQIKKEEESEEKDVINTTYFSAILNCYFYEHDKNLTEKQGLNRMKLHFKNNCSELIKPFYHHLATYHIEPNQTPCISSNFVPTPVLYPVFIPKCCPPPPDYPKRRDDINE